MPLQTPPRFQNQSGQIGPDSPDQWAVFYKYLQAAVAQSRTVYALSVAGDLQVGTDVAPITYVLTSFTPQLLRADLKGAPQGSALVVNLNDIVGAAKTVVATFTFPPGVKTATALSGVGFTAGSFMTLDVVSVGNVQSGISLTVTIQ